MNGKYAHLLPQTRILGMISNFELKKKDIIRIINRIIPHIIVLSLANFRGKKVLQVNFT